MTPKKLVLLLVGFGALASGPSFADSPLPPPQKKDVWSNSKHFCAEMDPRTRLTTVYSVTNGSRERKWAMPGWFRVAYLADDGEHLVIGHEGINLLPLDLNKDDILVYFVKKGQVVHTLPVSEVIKNKSSLKRTASHLLWGSYLGIDKEGHFGIDTVEGRSLYFDVTTGELAKAASSTSENW
ncbi:MAG: hypothetical protein RBS80_08845 [Thermoguttaceae bacterium]|jgi:hypothetical protein|nr:hypothetical protein [Thermoguttaceae bacterium]